MNAARLSWIFSRLPLIACPGLLLILLGQAPVALAWGERGHDLVTRVAVRTLHERLGADNKLTPALLIKEHQLGHLANVPDIVWRGMDETVRGQNAPTHFVDLEYLTVKPAVTSLPNSIGDALKLLNDQCSSPANRDNCVTREEGGSGAIADQKIMDKVGTAPWRVEQLASGLEEHWTRLKKLQDGKAEAKLQQAAFDEAIKFAGLLSHFVADLAQPLHTSKNYDGWDTNQGGIHAYFETEIVNELPLGFDQEVLDVALRQRPFEKIMKPSGKGSPSTASVTPLFRAWSLVADSFSQLPLVLDLDRRNLVAKSQMTKEGMKLPAKRKPAAASTKVFRSTITQRLATGADMLANIWLTACQNAGKPDLTTITSFNYFYAPEFIPAGYLSN